MAVLAAHRWQAGQPDIGAIMLMVAILMGLWLYAGGVLHGAYRADGPKAENR